MSPVIWILIVMVAVLSGVSGIALYNIIGYRSLTVKLSEVIKKMYCNHIDDNGKQCEFLRYYTTPVDGELGMITKYCSIHLVEKTGIPEG